MTPRTIGDYLTNLIEPIVGKRCKTTDKEDFHNEVLDEDSRCVVCKAYEDLDSAAQAIATEITKAKIDTLKRLKSSPLGMVSEAVNIIDERIKELEREL